MNIKLTNQLRKLVFTILPVMMIWIAFGAFFSYEMGGNGIDDISWSWILKSMLPVFIISFSLFTFAFRKLKASKIDLK